MRKTNVTITINGYRWRIKGISGAQNANTDSTALGAIVDLLKTGNNSDQWHPIHTISAWRTANTVRAEVHERINKICLAAARKNRDYCPTYYLIAE